MQRSLLDNRDVHVCMLTWQKMCCAGLVRETWYKRERETESYQTIRTAERGNVREQAKIKGLNCINSAWYSINNITLYSCFAVLLAGSSGKSRWVTIETLLYFFLEKFTVVIVSALCPLKTGIYFKDLICNLVVRVGYFSGVQIAETLFKISTPWDSREVGTVSQHTQGQLAYLKREFVFVPKTSTHLVLF